MKSIYFILITFYFFSCKQKPECNIAETIFYEKNEPCVEVFTINQLRTLADSTRIRLCNSDYFWSDLKVGNLHIPTDVFYYNDCDRAQRMGWGCRGKRPKTKLRILDSVTIELNRTILIVKDLTTIFQNHFFDLDFEERIKRRFNTVIVEWTDSVSTRDIEVAIQAIIDGYVAGIELSYLNEGKSFDCEEHLRKIEKNRYPNEDDIVQFGVSENPPLILSIDLPMNEK